MKTESPIFFDSHGFAWLICKPDHEAAVAFGPQFTARRLQLHWRDFARVDITTGEDGWDYLNPSLAQLLMMNIY